MRNKILVGAVCFFIGVAIGYCQSVVPLIFWLGRSVELMPNLSKIPWADTKIGFRNDGVVVWKWGNCKTHMDCGSDTSQQDPTSPEYTPLIPNIVGSNPSSQP